VVTGIAIGTATITAVVDGVRGTHVVNVAAGPVGSITVTPASSSIAQGDQATLTATLHDTLGAAVTGATVAWTSSNEAIATVSAAGVVTAVAPGGPVTVTATHATGVSGTATITVMPPRFAYTVADQPSAASYTPIARYTYNSSGGAITITRAATGSYQVRFAGQATPDGKSEIVLITASGPGEAYCKHGAPWANSGADLVATVACYTTLGTPADIAFNITLIGSGALGGRFGFTYADQEATASYFPQTRTYSSARQTMAVSRLSPGVYRVTFTGLAR
jgi:hypothetical protein